MRQQLAQFLAGSADMHSGGGWRASQGVPNLFVRQFQKVPHDDRCSLPIRKTRKGPGNIVAQFLSVQTLPDGTVLRAKAVSIDHGLFPRSATHSRPEHVAGTVHAYSQDDRPGTWVPRDPCPASPNDAQRFLQRIFGVLGHASDPPDRPQHLIVDRPDEGIVTRRFGVQMDTSPLVGSPPLQAGRAAFVK